MAAAIAAVPYAAAIKVGLQFKRRFWEEDDRIYGGISYTDLPIGDDRLSEHRLLQPTAKACCWAPTSGICSTPWSSLR